MSVSSHTVQPGAQFRPQVTVKVTSGQLSQANGDMLKCNDAGCDTNPAVRFDAYPHVGVQGTVSTGQSYTFTFYADHPMKAPSTPGTYTSNWRVWRSGQWTGPNIPITFSVGSASSSDGVELCEGSNYGSPCRMFTYSSNDTCISLGDLNKKVSSVRFRGSYSINSGNGYHAIMYNDTGCGTYLARYHGEDHGDLGLLNDTFASMRIEKHTPESAVELCENTNYGSPCRVFPYDNDAQCITFGDLKDKVSSLRFRGPYNGSMFHAIMFHDTGCGTYLARYFNQDVSELGLLDNQFNSMRIERHPCAPKDYEVALFVDPYYMGRCVIHAIRNYPNSGEIALPNDTISSVKVGAFARAILCEHDGFGGTCETLIGNDPDLSDNSIGNDRVSSAKAQIAPPSPPDLLSPNDGTRMSGAQGVVLFWSAPTTAAQYFGQVRDSLNQVVATIDWQSDRAKQLEWLSPGTYSWRVKALNSTDESSWSATWTFVVETTAPSAHQPDFGTGRDGDLTIATGQTVYTDDVRTILSTNAAANQRNLSVSGTAGFEAGQEVLIVQMQGANAGRYEFGVVDRVGAVSLVLTRNLTQSYTADSTNHVQVVHVPHYRTLTVEQGGTLTAHPWNGTSGGVLVFRALDRATIAGVIDGMGKGYRGFEKWPSSSESGYPGESTSGSAAQSTAANLSGGGGGQGWGDGGAGGGGGSYATAGTNGQSRPQNDSIVGGRGATITPGDPMLTTLVFGGAGGMGGSDDSAGSWAPYPCGMGGRGGAGGGIVAVYSRNITVSGVIRASGLDGRSGGYKCSGGAGGGGGGGGGAGGSIMITAMTASIGSERVTAHGGGGGPVDGIAGVGGAGGTGRIHIAYCQTLSGAALPAASSKHMDCTAATPTPAATSTSTPTSTSTATSTPTITSRTIYSEGLTAGWENWSWDTTIDFEVNDPVQTGGRAASVRYNQAWGGFYLHHANLALPADTILEFAIHGGSTGGQRINIFAKNASGVDQPPVALNDYVSGGSVAANTWRTVRVPLAALGVDTHALTGIMIQDSSGGSQPVFYLDDMHLVHEAATPTATASAPTVTPTPTAPATLTSTPTRTTTATPTPSSSTHTIYDDKLGSGWENWSWDSTVDFAIGTPVQTGSHAVSVGYDQTWAGFYLHHQGLRLASNTVLEFAIHGGTTGEQRINIFAKNSSGVDRPPVSLNDYVSGGSIAANVWRTVRVPLTTLGVGDHALTGIMIQDSSGGSQPVFYLDNIRLVSAATSTQIPSPSPTPTTLGLSGGIELLTEPWHLSGNNGADEAYQSIDPAVLQGKTMLRVKYNLHGLAALDGDASALIFDQDGWNYVSLADYGQNGFDGLQVVDIPLSNFNGLSLAMPVGTLHTRFWYGSPFTIDISSIVIY